MLAKLRPYALIFLKAFTGGFIVFGLLYLLFLGWPLNASTVWHTFRSALLTALLWIGNGIISDGVKISWIEYPLRRLAVSVVLTVIVTYAAGVLTDVIVWGLRHGRITMESLTISQDFYFSLLIITFFISLFMHGRHFLLSYRESIVAQEELKRANLASRYESLQNQVNPHFLFNSLNVLSNLVYKDADLSAKFIEQLAVVYRYVLESRDQEVVGLSREREVLDAYLFLLQIRFGEQLEIEIDLPEVTDELIPPLTLQLLAENAVKHNIISRKKPLKFMVAKEGQEIIVRNTLQPKQQEQESLGIGLSNIRERYQLLSEKSISVQEDAGWFEVRLPILQMQEAI